MLYVLYLPTHSWLSQGIILTYSEYHLMSVVVILVTNAIV